MAGKGSDPRPVDKAKYDEGYDRVFGKKKPYTPLDYIRDYPEMIAREVPTYMQDVLDSIMNKDYPLMPGEVPDDIMPNLERDRTPKTHKSAYNTELGTMTALCGSKRPLMSYRWHQVTCNNCKRLRKLK